MVEVESVITLFLIFLNMLIVSYSFKDNIINNSDHVLKTSDSIFKKSTNLPIFIVKIIVFLSNNQNNSLTNDNLFKNTNFTGYYLNNSVNYLFGLSGKIYNITSNLVNDYIVNPFQRLLRMLR